MIDENIAISKNSRKITWVGPSNPGVRHTVMELHECLNTLFDDVVASVAVGKKNILLINDFTLHFSMLDRLHDGKITDRNIKIEV